LPGILNGIAIDCRLVCPPLLQSLAAAGPQHIGDGIGGHGGTVRGALGGQPVPGLLLDQQLDQRRPLRFIVCLGQQPVLALIVESHILLTHVTPPVRTPHTPELFLIGHQPASTIRVEPRIGCNQL
jgi:hypothetical protein